MTTKKLTTTDKLRAAEGSNMRMMGVVNELSQTINQQKEQIELLKKTVENLASDMVSQETGEIVKAVFVPNGQMYSWAEIGNLVNALWDERPLTYYEKVKLAVYLLQQGIKLNDNNS